MLKHLTVHSTLYSPILPVFSNKTASSIPAFCICSPTGAFRQNKRRGLSIVCSARRAVRYEDDDDDDDEYGHNEEIAMLEMYTQSAKGEALLVRAMVDDEQVEVLIFKGFSSSLTHGTSPDPSRSILPARAVILSIDRIKGPFDPSNIEYLEKGLTWEDFKSRFSPRF